jgi:hypothetical protein
MPRGCGRAEAPGARGCRAPRRRSRRGHRCGVARRRPSAGARQGVPARAARGERPEQMTAFRVRRVADGASTDPRSVGTGARRSPRETHRREIAISTVGDEHGEPQRRVRSVQGRRDGSDFDASAAAMP